MKQQKVFLIGMKIILKSKKYTNKLVKILQLILKVLEYMIYFSDTLTRILYKIHAHSGLYWREYGGRYMAISIFHFRIHP